MRLLLATMSHQIPKKDHPWRRYKDRPRKDSEKEDATDKKALIEFLSDLVTNFNDYQIQDGVHLKKIRYMNEQNFALWLVSFIKRNYADREDDYTP